MDKCDKLLQKARRSPSNLGFEEVCRLAECFGFVFKRQDGTSHRIYGHPKLSPSMGGFMNFQNDKGKAKAYQVRQLLRAIENLQDE
jgi:hypothetical protein